MTPGFRPRAYQRGWHLVTMQDRYGRPYQDVAYRPNLLDRLVLRWQRAWRRWRAPH